MMRDRSPRHLRLVVASLPFFVEAPAPGRVVPLLVTGDGLSSSAEALRFLGGRVAADAELRGAAALRLFAADSLRLVSTIGDDSVRFFGYFSAGR